jgi:hypothetical protein
MQVPSTVLVFYGLGVYVRAFNSVWLDLRFESTFFSLACAVMAHIYLNHCGGVQVSRDEIAGLV